MAFSNARSAGGNARCERALIAVFVLLAVATPGEAQAYLDPATGGAFFQVILATIVGGLFALKMYGRRLKAFFTGRPLEGKPQEKKGPPPTNEGSSS